ncbi:uncharacterized protein LOC119112044 [Pollicipes pollicipes]|uniref:uncharacterized protein LOC119112044 n=1 Tax=Pollicipes pollicipes TaxID=41117 RepID=UPI0018854889|nr:uncharacterized protein LOC119112044 [Pollicipes pollicipes]XP_037091912.1 uncharacterized protein LOC119112044 [Pollicipes pollicipes]XP_037091913.1 uncharacterized protein LOC119112044 [Pollicipes pollicipes]
MYSYIQDDLHYMKKPVHPYDKKAGQKHFHLPEDKTRAAGAHGGRARLAPRPGMLTLVDQLAQRSMYETFSRSRSQSPGSAVSNDEPIELAHFPDAKVPNPSLPAAIERDDFPAPPYAYADPERRRRLSRPIRRRRQRRGRGRRRAGRRRGPEAEEGGGGAGQDRLWHGPGVPARPASAPAPAASAARPPGPAQHLTDAFGRPRAALWHALPEPSQRLSIPFPAQPEPGRGAVLLPVPRLPARRLVGPRARHAAGRLQHRTDGTTPLVRSVTVRWTAHSRKRHLTDEEFFAVFRMSPAEFYKLPDWRRKKLKKAVHLY